MYLKLRSFTDQMLPTRHMCGLWPVVCSYNKRGKRMAQLTPDPPSSSIRPILFIERHRRGSRRLSSNAAVDVLGPSKGNGVAINQSSGGLRVAVDCDLMPGDICLVRVHDPLRPNFERARVAWSRTVSDGCIAGLELLTVH
jgi:hypothetical protein